MNQRLHYIDVAKGILILMVVFDHLPDMYFYRLGGGNLMIKYIDDVQWVYKCFFMPAFFVLTGFCSNFHVPIKQFIIKNFKTLIIPGIVIGFIDAAFNPNSSLKSILINIIHDGGFFWFLVALFEAKMIYYLLVKYEKDLLLIGVTCLLLMILGFSLNTIPYKYNFFYFVYSLSLLFFLHIGQILKIANVGMKILFLMSLVYMLTILILLNCGIKAPQIAMGFDNSVSELPLSLLTSITGSAFVIFIARLINKNRILEFFGRESIIFYTFEFSVIVSVEYLLLHVLSLDISTFKGVSLFVVTTYITSLLILSACSLLLRTKHFKWILGDF